MTDNNNMQADITLDFDNAEKANERRKRRSTIFEMSRTLGNVSCIDNSHAMDVDNVDKNWKKCYMEDVQKEIDDWKCTAQSFKNQRDHLLLKLENGESLNNLVPSQLISDEEKKFLKGSEVYKTYVEKIQYTIESFAMAEKLLQITDSFISNSVETLEDKFTSELKAMWLLFNNNNDYSIESIDTSEYSNMDNLPYPEPFLQDFSNV